MGSFASQPAPHLTVWRVLLVAGGSAFDGTPERLHASLEDVVREHARSGPCAQPMLASRSLLCFPPSQRFRRRGPHARGLRCGRSHRG